MWKIDYGVQETVTMEPLIPVSGKFVCDCIEPGILHLLFDWQSNELINNYCEILQINIFERPIRRLDQSKILI